MIFNAQSFPKWIFKIKKINTGPHYHSEAVPFITPLCPKAVRKSNHLMFVKCFKNINYRPKKKKKQIMTPIFNHSILFLIPRQIYNVTCFCDLKYGSNNYNWHLANCWQLLYILYDIDILDIVNNFNTNFKLTITPWLWRQDWQY